MHKRIVYIIFFAFLATSCGDTLGSVKRGLTGAKAKGGDEFLVQKKDPLILPPDFENLPTPEDRIAATEEISVLEKRLDNSIEENSSTPSSVEGSILKKIQSR